MGSPEIIDTLNKHVITWFIFSYTIKIIFLGVNMMVECPIYWKPLVLDTVFNTWDHCCLMVPSDPTLITLMITIPTFLGKNIIMSSPLCSGLH